MTEKQEKQIMAHYKESIEVGDLVKLESKYNDGHIYKVEHVKDGIVYATSTTDSTRGLARVAYVLTWA